MESSNRGQVLIFEATAYALAGMFLLAGLVNSSIVLTVLGWIFMVCAVGLIIASFFRKIELKGRKAEIVNWIQAWMPILLFLVTFVEFVSESVKPQENIYVIIMYIFLLLLGIGVCVQFYRTVTLYMKKQGKK